jgi:hypothetical protein
VKEVMDGDKVVAAVSFLKVILNTRVLQA